MTVKHPCVKKIALIKTPSFKISSPRLNLAENAYSRIDKEESAADKFKSKASQLLEGLSPTKLIETLKRNVEDIQANNKVYQTQQDKMKADCKEYEKKFIKFNL